MAFSGFERIAAPPGTMVVAPGEVNSNWAHNRSCSIPVMSLARTSAMREDFGRGFAVATKHCQIRYYLCSGGIPGGCRGHPGLKGHPKVNPDSPAMTLR